MASLRELTDEERDWLRSWLQGLCRRLQIQDFEIEGTANDDGTANIKITPMPVLKNIKLDNAKCLAYLQALARELEEQTKGESRDDDQ